MSSPWVAAGRAFFATENSALMYLAKAEGSRVGAGVPSRLKAPSSANLAPHFPHTFLFTSNDFDWRPKDWPQSVPVHAYRYL